MKWYLSPDGVEFSSWVPRAIAAHIGNVSLTKAEPEGAQTYGSKKLYPLTDPGANPPAGQTVANRSIAIADGVATASYTYTARTDLDAYKAERIAEVAQKRWEVETGGTTVANTLIDTSRESQGLINGAYNLAQRNTDTVGFTLDFKGRGGWVTLNAATMIAIGEAVAVHVQDCFKREKALSDAITACTTVAEVAAIDITTGWPE